MDALADDIARAFDLIARQPRIGKMADPPDSIQSRRIYLNRIHYYLYYSVDDPSETVEVLAFWHAREVPLQSLTNRSRPNGVGRSSGRESGRKEETNPDLHGYSKTNRTFKLFSSRARAASNFFPVFLLLNPLSFLVFLWSRSCWACVDVIVLPAILFQMVKEHPSLHRLQP